MRATLICLLALGGGLLAQEDQPEAKPPPQQAKPVLKDGRFTDPFWALSYERAGLELGMPTGDPTVIFVGKTKDVHVNIKVYEGRKPLAVGEWVKLIRKAWEKRQRKLENVTEGTDPQPWIIFTEMKLGVFEEHHGSAFHARGLHCFEVHAYVGDKTETSGQAIAAALKGFKLGEDKGCGLVPYRFALASGKALDDPELLLAAGVEYVTGRQLRIQNYGMAATVLKRARSLMKEDTYNAAQLWTLYEYGGLAHLSGPDRTPKEAIDWHAKAEEAAKKLPAEGRVKSQAQSTYNLACAYSLSGDVDKGFEALYRAFSESMPVDAAHLTGDTDLDNLKRDEERWTRFWQAKVAGK